MAKTAKKSGKGWMFLILILIVAAGLYSAWWFVARGQTANTIHTQIEALEAEGYDVSHRGISMSGFPLYLRGDAADIKITAPEERGSWSAQAEGMNIKALALNPMAWAMDITGDVRIDASLPGGERLMMTSSAARLHMDVKAGADKKPKQIDLDIQTYRAQPLIATPPPILAAESFTAQSTFQDLDMVTVWSGEDIRLGAPFWPDAQAIMGNRIQSLGGSCSVSHYELFLARDFEAWERQTGRIICEDVQMDWGGNLMSVDFDLVATPQGFNGDLTPTLNLDPGVRDNIVALAGQKLAGGEIDQSEANSMATIYPNLPIYGQETSLPLKVRNGKIIYLFVTLGEIPQLPRNTD